MMINSIGKNYFESYTVTLFIQGILLFTFQTAAIKRLSPFPMTTLMLLWDQTFVVYFLYANLYLRPYYFFPL
jgi:hypothetical protein